MASFLAERIWALTICTRMVWPRMVAISLARAIMRASLLASRSSTNGATDQPTSTWPDMTWVMVAEMSPVATGFAFNPYSLMKRRTPIWEDAPVVEYAMVWPTTSRIDRKGDLAATHQKFSLDPVELAPMMRMGAPLAEAPRLPSVPALKPTSTELEITACSVSPPPCV